ncbi:MAG: T9SS type A sorting domain-containing protein [Chitinophagales bacterium]
MKRVFIPLTACLLWCGAYAQYPPLSWAKKIEAKSTNNKYTGVMDVKVDGAGGIYIGGSFRDSLRIDQAQPNFYLKGSENYDQGYFAKFNADGTLAWTGKITSPAGYLYVNSVALDKYRNTYVFGQAIYCSSIYFNPASLADSLVSDGQDYFVAKYDAGGNYLWAKIINVGAANSAFSNTAACILVDSNSNFYLAGSFSTTIDMDPGPGLTTLTNPGGLNCNCTVGFYGKYDSTGVPLWSRMDANSICVNDMAFYQAGGQLATVATSNGAFSGFPLRLVNSVTGATTDSLNSVNMHAQSVRFDRTGNLYFSGYIANQSNFSWNGNVYMNTGHSYETVGFVAKYDNTKYFQWAYPYSPTNDTSWRGDCYKIDIDYDDNVLVGYREGGPYNVKGFFKINSNTGAVMYSSGMFLAYEGLNPPALAVASRADASMVYAMDLGVPNSTSPVTIDADLNPNVTYNLSSIGDWSALAKYGSCTSAPPMPPAISGLTSICSGLPQTYSVSSSGSELSYTWALPSGWSGSSTTNSITVTPAANGGTISVYATNACGNSLTRTLNVTYTSPPNVTASASATTICAGSSVTLTGNGATTYQWNNGVSNGVAFAPVSTTTYMVTGTQGSCSDTSAITITVNQIPNVNANATAVNICSGSQTTLSGTGATTYSWSNGVTNGVAFTPAATTTYIVTGTQNGCSDTAAVTVTVKSNPVVNAGATATTLCNGSSTTLSGSGASSYVWSNGVTNGVAFTPAYTQTYIVTGTLNGCTDTASITVTVNPIPNVNASASVNSICAGGQTTLNGTGAATYSWSNGVTNGVAFTPAATTTYIVTGTQNGCSDTAAVTVTVKSNPVVNAGATATTLCSGNQTTLSGSGATSYVWNNGVTNGVAFTPAGTQTYIVTGTLNGCTDTASITVTVNPIPNVSASATQTQLCTGSSTTLNGNGAAAYVWSNGVTNGVSFTPAATTTYTVTGTLNACTATASLTVTVDSVIHQTITPTICNNESYLLPNGNTVTAAGVYNSTFTSQAGCDSIITVNLSVYPTFATSIADSICKGDVYLFGTKQLTEAGSYKDTLSAVTGCDSIITLQLNVKEINASIIQSGVAAYVVDSSSDYTYQWVDCNNNAIINNANAASYLATANGNYAVIIHDGFCTDTSNCLNITGVGLTESAATTLLVVPNPAHYQFTIKLDKIGPFEMMLTDMSGRIVIRQWLLESQTDVFVNTLSAGIYALKLESASEIITTKIYVE